MKKLIVMLMLLGAGDVFAWGDDDRAVTREEFETYKEEQETRRRREKSNAETDRMLEEMRERNRRNYSE